MYQWEFVGAYTVCFECKQGIKTATCTDIWRGYWSNMKKAPPTAVTLFLTQAQNSVQHFESSIYLQYYSTVQLYHLSLSLLYRAHNNVTDWT